MTPEQFDRYRELDLTRVPVAVKRLADMETPLSCYLKLADRPWSYLLESVTGGETWGRYSCIGLPSRERIEVSGPRITRFERDEVVEIIESNDPLTWISDYQVRLGETPSWVIEELDLPKFTGGLVGYFGYDTIQYVEPRVAKTLPENDPIGSPDIILMRSDDVVVFDNLSGMLTLITHANPQEQGAYEAACERLDDMLDDLASAMDPSAFYPTEHEPITEADYQYSLEKDAFKNAVKEVKEYIQAGDVMQTVLSQRISVPYAESPLSLYRALRVLNPSPYMYFLNLDDTHIVGSSPEILARLEDGHVSVRPIAGTRPRGKTQEEDAALENELLADPKEISEHLMLIDLGRNDVGRVAEIGSVELTDNMVVERYSHVMHIVSHVEGKVRPDVSALDVLKACLPAGTLSGAPKVRAMELINQFEPVRRGIYGGAVGYLGWSGNMDTAIAIRTAVIKGGMMHIQAGAGLVADSIPQSEWMETLNKGRAVIRAANAALTGFKDLKGPMVRS
ncbi:MAG: anthranilate synthase component I [Gammaproteobacteria bacterium]|jgi:anthranilate synthase component 1|nr:anthranilate synthase component I [Gammaproteobacteria bacterium]